MTQALRRRIAVALTIAALFGSISWVHAVPIYGGPTYDAAAFTGYQSPQMPLGPGSAADNGTAVGWAEKYLSGNDQGARAIRWDASGAISTELGTLGTDSSGTARTIVIGISSSGTAVGYATKYVSGVGKGDRAVRWDASSTAATELGNLGTDTSGSTGSQAYAINTTGTTVGWAYKYVSGTSKGTRAVRWDALGTTANELGTLGDNGGGFTLSYGYGISSSGTVVGSASKYISGSSFDKGQRAVRWGASSTNAVELGNLGTDNLGSTNSAAKAVNAAGTAVGFADTYVSNIYVGEHAVRRDASGTTATELGNLGTATSGYTNSNASDINSAGMAVGWTEKYLLGSDKGLRAVRWGASSTTAIEMGNLGTATSGYTSSFAYAINTYGTAVGAAEDYDLTGTDLGQRAVAWGLDDIAIDLNTLLDPGSGWVNLYEADGISDTGWITGRGSYDADGAGPGLPYNRMFLLNASSVVPEPASLVLLAAAALTILPRRHNRQRPGA